MYGLIFFWDDVVGYFFVDNFSCGLFEYIFGGWVVVYDCFNFVYDDDVVEGG